MISPPKDAVHLTTIEVRKVNYQVFVTKDGDFWTCVNPDTAVMDATLEGLKKKISSACRLMSIRVAVPFCVVEGHRVLNGTAVGIHGSTNMVLVQWSGDREKKNEQLAYGPLSRVLRPLSEDEELLLLKLLVDVRDAVAERDKFLTAAANKLDLVHAVKVKIAEIELAQSKVKGVEAKV